MSDLEKDSKPVRARNRGEARRDKGIVIRVSKEEKERIREVFGRLAPAAARAYLLHAGRRPSIRPTRRHLLDVVRAIHFHRGLVLELRRMVGSPQLTDGSDLLQEEEQAFNHLIHLWLSSFSGLAANETNPEG